jgi:hypothetical protein
LTAIWLVDAADQVEQGALAAAALSQNSRDLPGLEFGMSILQHHAADIAFVIGFAQVMESKKRIHGVIVFGMY